VDVHKKERDFQQLTLSDENVVKYLITYRSKVDVSYGAVSNIDINQAGDMFEFNQELIALYASLDKLTKSSKLTDKQVEILEYFYKGYTASDIAKSRGTARKYIYETLNVIVGKIVTQNNIEWKKYINQRRMDK
jgi:DNA-binding NarL/FixJ family response regulator